MNAGLPRIAVTGASGFAGRYLSAWLAQRYYQVLRVSRDPALGPDVRTIRPEPGLRDLRAAFAGADVVAHLAARAHRMEDTAGDPLARYRAVNVELTRTAVRAAADAGARMFIFASSVKAMGERTTIPWTEQMEPRPVDPYGLSKLEAERVVGEEGARYGLRTVILRLPAMYGPGMRANMLRLFGAVARGIPLPFGAIGNRRSFLFIGNAAAAIEAVARVRDPGACYFVSDGTDVSTPELVTAIARALDRRPRLVAVPVWLFRLAGKVGWPLSGDRVQRLLDSLQVDSSRFRADLDFTPPYSLPEGLRETAAWYLGRSA
jgi:nucleoside-diphosphate-sugar epimerase